MPNVLNCPAPSGVMWKYERVRTCGDTSPGTGSPGSSSLHMDMPPYPASGKSTAWHHQPPVRRRWCLAQDRRARAVANADAFGRSVAHVPVPVGAAGDQHPAGTAARHQRVRREQRRIEVAEVAADGNDPAIGAQPQLVMDERQGIGRDRRAHRGESQQDVDVRGHRAGLVERHAGSVGHVVFNRLLARQHAALGIPVEQFGAARRMGADPVEDGIVVAAHVRRHRVPASEQRGTHGCAAGSRRSVRVGAGFARSGADAAPAQAAGNNPKCVCSIISAVCSAPSTQPCCCEYASPQM